MSDPRQIRVLIVDDNESLCRSMALILNRKGYTVTVATDGLQALEVAREHAFDIAFMDIKMPTLDGVETFKRLKRLRPNAPVIMMTAYALEELVQEALQEGAYGVIYKPLDMDKVLGIIEEARQNRQGALVLIVDDDPESCDTLRTILERKGFHVGVAHSGEAAIDLAWQHKYDILLIDLKLPTLNGLETYRAIKAIRPDAAAILLTAYRQEMGDLIRAAQNESAYACLYKPLDMDEVLGLLEHISQQNE